MARYGKKVDLRTGEGRCRNCGGPITEKRRQTFCSASCVDEWKIACSPKFAAMQVFRRDKGVCAECGLDCDRLEGRLLMRVRSRRANMRLAVSIVAKRGEKNVPKHVWAAMPVGLQGMTIWSFDSVMTIYRYVMLSRIGVYSRNRLWEVDHIVAVRDGGGRCGIENLRTLCCKCHKTRTVAQNRRHGLLDERGARKGAKGGRRRSPKD